MPPLPKRIILRKNEAENKHQTTANTVVFLYIQQSTLPCDSVLHNIREERFP